MVRRWLAWVMLQIICVALVTGGSAAALNAPLLHLRQAAEGGGVEPSMPDSSVGRVPAVFANGAWDPAAPGPLNAYVAALLSKDVYYKHVVDPKGPGRHGPLARRNFTLFAEMFCGSMRRLGADECEAVNGASSLVWALVRAGPSVLVVARGSNSPQNWITDLVSLRTVNVGDFGGGSRGTNVAAGFYQVFAANRRDIVDRVRESMLAATAAAVALARNGGGGNDLPRLWVFGHSLGGAVALMAASYLHLHEDLPVTGVYVFGCPRVGDDSWARAYPLDDVTIRLENTGDVVPTLPFGSRWSHVGSAFSIQYCRALPPAPPGAMRGSAAAVGGGADAAVVSYDTDSGFEAAMMGSAEVSGGGTGGGGDEGSGSTAGGGSIGDGGGGAASAALQLLSSPVVGKAEAEVEAAPVVRRLLRSEKRATIRAALTAPGSIAGAGLERKVDVEVGAQKEGAAEVEAEEEAQAEAEMASKILEAVAAEGGLEAVAETVSFPFPFSIRDHMVQTYVRVMWSCLTDNDQDLVPGPEDAYEPYKPSMEYGAVRDGR